MIVNSFIVPGLNDEYKTLHVKLAEFLNLIVVFWDLKLSLGSCISLEGSFRILMFWKFGFEFSKKIIFEQNTIIRQELYLDNLVDSWIGYFSVLWDY